MDAADVDRADVAAQLSCCGAGLEHHAQDLLDLIADRSGSEASGSAHGDQGFADAAPFTRPLGEVAHPGVESLCGLLGGQEDSRVIAQRADLVAVDLFDQVLPGTYSSVRSDARVLADTDALVATVSERFGSLDLLFLNAGIFRLAPVADVTA